MQKIKKEGIEVKEEENRKLNEGNPGNQPEKQTSWNRNEQLKLTAAAEEEDQDIGRRNPNTNKEERKRQQTDSTHEGEEEHIPDTH